MSVKKTVVTLTLSMLLAVASVSLVGAQEKSAAPSAGNADVKAFRMNPEQWEAFEGLRAEHWAKMAPIQDQLWAKQLEYEALADNPNAKPAEIKAVIDDMVKLRTQLRGERSNFYNQAQEKGLNFGPGNGRGFGGHYGPGCGMGYGPGHGWGRDDDRRGHYGQGHGWGRDDDRRGWGHRGGGRGGHHGGIWRD